MPQQNNKNPETGATSRGRKAIKIPPSRIVMPIVLVIGLVFPMILSTMFAYNLQRKSVESGFQFELNQYAQSLASSMHDPIWNLIPDAGRPLLESMMDNPRILSIRVVSDAQGEILSVSRPAPEFVRPLELGRDVLHAGDKIGRVFLSIDASVLDTARRRQWTLIVTVLVVQVLLSLAVVLFVYRYTGRQEREWVLTAMNRKLRESEGRLKSFMDFSPLRMEITDHEGRFTMINRRSAELYDRSAEFCRGRSPSEVLPVSIAGTFENHNREVFELDEAISREEQFETDLGTRSYLTIKFPLRDAEGQIMGLGASGIDITERLRATEALRTAHDELEQRVTERTQEFLVAKDAAEVANLAKTKFLSSMSHELRTPLNAILGFAQLLQHLPIGKLNDRQLDYVSHILRGGNHLLELIDQILELAKIEAGQVTLNIEDISVNEIFAECRTLVQARAESRGIELEPVTDTPYPPVRADRTRLRQVLLNLLSNAVKYNKTGGRVVLDAEVQGDILRISVADTGWGVAADLQDKLFEPFNRLGMEASDIEGTGIGLNITRQLVELMGGHIGFESEQGRGSVFWVDLPLAPTERRKPPTAAVPPHREA